MKIKKSLIFLAVIFLFCSACSARGGFSSDGISIPEDVEMTAESFKAFFNADSYSAYEAEDYTAQFTEELQYPIEAYIIADSEEDNITFEFMIFENESAAKKSYGNYAAEMDAEVTAQTFTAEETNEDHAKYVFSEQKYRSITRIGKTIIMAAAEEDQGERVQTMLLEMGY